MKKIGIIGTRRRDKSSDQKLIEDKFFEVYEDGDWIVTGGCPKGGDRFALDLAKKNGIPILTFYPDYKKFGRGAPLVRNGEIAKNSDVIIACVVDPEDGVQKVLERKRGGTEDTLKKFTLESFVTENVGRIYLV